MDRLTFEGNFCDIAMCQETPGGSFCEDGYCSQRKVWERLKQYEDTWLEPEDVSDLALKLKTLETIESMYDGLGNPVHLREMVQDEQDGRLSITPATVWHKGKNGLHVVPYKPWMARWIGIRFWLSREEAEAVLASIDRKEGAE